MDKWPSFQTLTFREFEFTAKQCIEYVDGNVNLKSNVNLKIIFKQHNGGNYNNGGLITVDIIDLNKNCAANAGVLNNKIIPHIEFDTCITMDDRLMFYIHAEKSNIWDFALQMVGDMMGFTRPEKNYVANEPIIGNVFTEQGNIAKIAFRFVNPDRLIEFV